MTFDAIVGNPPYQIANGGNNASAMPVYQRFVELATTIEPHYASMIMPSRWYSGGRGLDDFRANIMNDTRMRVLYDYASSDYCFPGVDISGGICYFLWDKDYDGPCTVTDAESQIAHSVKRYLTSSQFWFVLMRQFQLLIRLQEEKSKRLIHLSAVKNRLACGHLPALTKMVTSLCVGMVEKDRFLAIKLPAEQSSLISGR